MTSNRQRNVLDDLVSGFDRGLRTIMGTHQASRPNPAENFEEGELTARANPRSGTYAG